MKQKRGWIAITFADPCQKGWVVGLGWAESDFSILFGRVEVILFPRHLEEHDYGF